MVPRMTTAENCVVTDVYYKDSLLHTVHLPLDSRIEEIREKILNMFNGPPPDNFMFDLEFVRHRVAREQYNNYSQVVLPRPPVVYVMSHKKGFTLESILSDLDSRTVDPEYTSQYSYVQLPHLRINICASSICSCTPL